MIQSGGWNRLRTMDEHSKLARIALDIPPGLEDLWQLHYAAESDRDHNMDPDHIANVKENCEGKYFKVTAESDGAFTLTNTRTGNQKTYPKK